MSEVICPENSHRPAIHPGIIASYRKMDDQADVTRLLTLLSTGDRSVEEALLPKIYLELHRLAIGQLRSESVTQFGFRGHSRIGSAAC